MGTSDQRSYQGKSPGGGGGYADVGSNIGLHAVYAAGLMGNERKVFAIEPNPNVFEILKRNMDVNGYFQSTVFFKGAVSNYNGDGVIYIYEGHAGGSGFGIEPEYLSKVQEQHVNVKTLDSIVGDEVIDVLKIDVEGFELNVLKGSNNILNSNQENITVIMEWHPDDMRIRVGRDAPEQVLDIMRQYEFKCYQANYMNKLKRVSLDSNDKLLSTGADLIFTKRDHLDKLCVSESEQEDNTSIVNPAVDIIEFQTLKEELEFSRQAFWDAVAVQEDLKRQITELNDQIVFSKQAFLDAVAIQEQLKKKYDQPSVKEALRCFKNCVFHGSVQIRR